MQSLLSGLPEVWQIDILLLWPIDKRYYNNSLIDLGRLDIAFCCLSQRPAWLKLLSSDHFVVGGVRLKKCSHWLALRGVKMNTISIDKDFSEHISSYVLTLNLSKVSTILYMESQHMHPVLEQASHQESLQLIFSRCLALTSLTVFERESSLCTFTNALFYSLSDQQLKQLKQLTVAQSYCDSEVLSRVTDMCESLETFTVPENLSVMFTPDVLLKCVNRFRRLKTVALNCLITVDVIKAMSNCLPWIESLTFNGRTDFSGDDDLKYALMNLIQKSLCLTNLSVIIGSVEVHLRVGADNFLYIYGPSNTILAITQTAQNYDWLAFVFSLDRQTSKMIGLLLDIPLNDWCLNQIAHALPNIRHIQLCDEHSDFTIDTLKAFLMKCTPLVKVYCGDCHHLPIVELVELLFSATRLTRISFRHTDFEPRMMENVKLSDSLVSVSINEVNTNTSWVYEKNQSE